MKAGEEEREGKRERERERERERTEVGTRRKAFSLTPIQLVLCRRVVNDALHTIDFIAPDDKVYRILSFCLHLSWALMLSVAGSVSHVPGGTRSCHSPAGHL